MPKRDLRYKASFLIFPIARTLGTRGLALALGIGVLGALALNTRGRALALGIGVLGAHALGTRGAVLGTRGRALACAAMLFGIYTRLATFFNVQQARSLLVQTLTTHNTASQGAWTSERAAVKRTAYLMHQVFGELHGRIQGVLVRVSQCFHLQVMHGAQKLRRLVVPPLPMPPKTSQNLQGTPPQRSRRSTRVIWFREGSPKEGNRIVAWYKLEWELGLSSGFTENYPPRSR